MGSQLRWLERTPDKREVDGSIPFEPTKYIENCIDDEKKVTSILKNILETIEPKKRTVCLRFNQKQRKEEN